jgi:hypothetical protein
MRCASRRTAFFVSITGKLTHRGYWATLNDTISIQDLLHSQKAHSLANAAFSPIPRHTARHLPTNLLFMSGSRFAVTVYPLLIVMNGRRKVRKGKE